MSYREEKSLLNPNDIQLMTLNYTVANIVKLIKEKEIEIYENMDIVSISDKEKSLIIETMMLNIPITPIYFDENVTNYTEQKWKPIRGYNTLKTLKEFIIDETFALTELEFLPQIGNRRYSDLPRIYRRRLDIYSTTIVILETGTSEEAKYPIYERLNMPEKLFNKAQIDYIIKKDKQEYRIVRRFMNLVEAEKLFWNKGVLLIEIEDAVSRYLIFRKRSYRNYYEPFQNFKAKQLEGLVFNRRHDILFGTTLEQIKNTFGSSLFFIKDKFYPTLFELWLVFLVDENIHIKKILSDTFFTRIENLYTESKFIKSLKSDTKKNVSYRYERFKEFLVNHLNYLQ